jgi:hypothetical protein
MCCMWWRIFHRVRGPNRGRLRAKSQPQSATMAQNWRTGSTTLLGSTVLIQALMSVMRTYSYVRRTGPADCSCESLRLHDVVVCVWGWSCGRDSADLILSTDPNLSCPAFRRDACCLVARATDLAFAFIALRRMSWNHRCQSGTTGKGRVSEDGQERPSELSNKWGLVLRLPKWCTAELGRLPGRRCAWLRMRFGRE